MHNEPLPSPRIPPRAHFALVPALLAVFFMLATFSIYTKAPTFDEPVHLSAGWSYLKTWDFRMNYEHPPLMKQIAALPLLTMPLGQPTRYLGWGIPDGKNIFTHYFLFEGNDFQTIFRRAHTAMTLAALLLGLWIYLWSRQLWGPDGALLSLTLFAFSPNLLAHAGMVHTDYGFAAFGLLSLWLWARMLCRPTLGRTALAGVGSALSLLAKFSSLSLIPLWLLWLAISIVSRGRWPANIMERGNAECGMRNAEISIHIQESAISKVLLAWVGRLALIVAIVAGIVYADYGFDLRYLRMGWATFHEHLNLGHCSYLHGKIDQNGFWYYFLAAYLIKTPLPEIILLGATLACWVRDRRGWGPWALLALPFFAILTLASMGNVDIGYRHILILTPLAMVMAGALAARQNAKGKMQIEGAAFSDNPQSAIRNPQSRRLWRFVLPFLICWQVFIGLFYYPNYLSYFNELIGGPRNGWKWLSDSNIDWGQDLKMVVDFVHDYNVPVINLAYFGTCDVDCYGIKFRRLYGYDCLNDHPIWEFDRDHPPQGVYAIFTSNLGGQYLRDRDTFKWFREHEPDFRLGNSVFIYNVTSGPIGTWQRERN